MTLETLFALLMSLAGLGVLRLTIPGMSRQPLLLAALSLPLGIVVYCMIGLALLLVRAPFATAALVAPLVILALVTLGLSFKNRRPSLGDLLILAGLTAACAGISLSQAVTSVQDARQMLMMGIDLVHGNQAPWTQEAGLTLGYPLLYQFLHAASYALEGVPARSTQALLFANLCLLIGIAVFRHARDIFKRPLWPSIMAAVFVALYVSTTVASFHALYIGPHVATALFILAFATLTHAALGAPTRATWLLAACLLTGVVFARLEGPVYALLLLVVIWQEPSVPQREWRHGALIVCLVSILIYAAIAPHALYRDISALSHANRLAMIAVLSGAAVFLSVPEGRSWAVDRLAAFARSRLFLALLLAVAAAPLVLAPGRAVEVAVILWSNLGDHRQWGGLGIAWLVLLPVGLAELAWISRRRSLVFADRLLLAVAVSMLAMLASAVVAGTPFASGQILSSMSRVPMHFLPLFLAWAGYRAARFVAGVNETRI
jgi:hypothetical protein